MPSITVKVEEGASVSALVHLAAQISDLPGVVLVTYDVPVGS